MKFMTLITLFVMSITLISCGGDDKDSKSKKGFEVNKLSTQNGYYNIQTGALEVGGQVYPPNQAYAQVMQMALSQAQSRNIQPITHNGVQKFRAKITAQLMNYQQGYNQPYNNTYQQQGGFNQGYNQTGYNQNTLSLQNVVIY